MDLKRTQRSLLKLQRQVFESLGYEVQSLLGAEPAPLRNYRLRAERELTPKRLAGVQALTPGRFHQTLRQHQVIAVGDYHAYPQSQRTALRLLRALVKKGEFWNLGLECVGSHHQAELDRYLKGRMSLSALRRKIEFDSQWGFSWQPYAELFEYARENKIRLIALNHPAEFLKARIKRNPTLKDLELRDRWAAGILSDLHQYAGASATSSTVMRTLLLFGEHHLASQHLPRALHASGLSLAVIHQTPNSLYWKIAKNRPSLLSSALKLRALKNIDQTTHTEYCLFHSTPWAKLQALLDWADADAQADAAPTTPLEWMPVFAQMIAKALQVSLTPRAATRLFSNLELYTLLHPPRGLPPLMAQAVRQNRRLYWTRGQRGFAYLGAPHLNRCAEVATLHALNFGLTPQLRALATAFARRSADHAGYWEATCWETALGFFGSLIINPHRKCDTLEDHKRKLRSLRRLKQAASSGSTSESTRYDAEIQSRLWILRALSRALSAKTIPELPRTPWEQFLCARLYGRWLGFHLYKQMTKNRRQPTEDILREGLAQLVESRRSSLR